MQLNPRPISSCSSSVIVGVIRASVGGRYLAGSPCRRRGLRGRRGGASTPKNFFGGLAAVDSGIGGNQLQDTRVHRSTDGGGLVVE